MANRDMTNQQYSFEKMRKILNARVTFGSTGAATLDGPRSKGVLSVTRQATGLFGAGVLTFQFGASAGSLTPLDSYVKLLSFRAHFDVTNAAAVVPAANGDIAILQDQSWNLGGVTVAPVQATPVASSGGGFASGAYKWVITSIDANGQESLSSNELSLSPTSNQQVALSWAAATGAVTYNVYRTLISGAAGTEQVFVGNTAALTLADAGTLPTAGVSVTTYGYKKPPLALASVTLGLFTGAGSQIDPALGEVGYFQFDFGDSIAS